MKPIRWLINKVKGKENIGVILLLIFTSFLYLTNLSINQYANSYYTAAVQAASTSWKAFFFGSLDGASFITVDKPPVAIWLMALSVRLFGFSSFTMLLPNALAGIITVFLIYKIVKQFFGHQSGLIAGFVLPLTPVAALMFRFNNPDAILTMFLTLSSYFFLKSLNSKPIKNLLLTAIFTGFAFNTKMVQGLVLLPVMVLIYLFFAQTKFFKKILHLLFAFLMTAIFCLWWPTIVWLTPANSRPYIGSSSNNSVWNLIIGYNGLNRLLGGDSKLSGGPGNGNPPGGSFNNNLIRYNRSDFNFNQEAPQNFDHQFDGRGPGGGNPPSGSPQNGNRGGNNFGPGGNGFGGQTGIFRMFNSDFGPNIGWLIPFALIGSIVAVIKNKLKKSPVILFFLGWLVIHTLVFSITSGTIHPYYVVVMAPAIAALVGISLPFIINSWFFPLTVGITAYATSVILDYSNYWPWLKYFIIISAGISVVLFIFNKIKPIKIIRFLFICFSFLSCLSAPIFYTFSTIIIAHTGSIPTSGLAGTSGHTNNESSRADQNLVDYLLSHQDGATWIVAVSSADESASIQITSGQPVMATGGFNGGDNALSLEKLKELVSSGQLKYFLISTNNKSGMRFGPGGDNDSILSWIKENGTVIDYSSNSGTLYLLN